MRVLKFMIKCNNKLCELDVSKKKLNNNGCFCIKRRENERI